jgi:hypothetical protein
VHIVLIAEFAHTTSISIHIGVDDITSLAHEVLHILPAGRLGKLGQHTSPLTAATTSSGLGATSVSSVSIITTIIATTTASLREFYTKAIAIKHVAISATNGIIGISGIIERNESKGGRARAGLDINIYDSTILVKQVVNLSLPNIHWEVSNIQTISHGKDK